MVSVEVLGSTYGDDEFRALLINTMDTYQITTHSLSKITGIDENVITGFANGDMDVSIDLRKDFNSLLELITMLSIGMEKVDENDRVRAIIEGLNHVYDITIDTLALYSKVHSDDILQFLKDVNSVPLEKRYRIAVTSLFLHYLFKQSQKI
ncbi:MAG: HTH domain-containing protein [Bacillota bacterium]